MVQADATRNYYQDLGVAANADESEIRKAFRQLALKFHPDRNPGREAEVLTKFQQIQAAHEILSDPAQRAKYDHERRKYRSLNIPPYNPNTPRTRPQPPSRNTYTTTTPSGSYYRAPPPKPPPQRPPPPQHHSTFANGAERFTSKNFRPPPPAQRPSARPTDAEARANVFTAWQKMKQPRAEEPRPPPPNVPNPNGSPFGRSNTTRTPSSKKGFDPATPGGDEGQARSSYRSNYGRPVPSPPRSGDPLKHFREQMGEDRVPNVPYAEGNRVRTPYYSSTGGERTSMFEDGIGRSSSVRNSPKHRPGSSTDAESFSDSGRKGQRHSHSGNSSNPFPHMYVSSSDEEPSEADSFRRRAGPPPKPPPTTQQKPPPPMFSKATASGPDTNPNVFKSRSEESINMKFSPSDWHGKFEGKPDYFVPNVPPGMSAKGRTSPTRGRPSQRTAAERTPFSGQSQPPPPVSPLSVPQSAQMPPPPPPPLNTKAAFPAGSASAPHTAKFTQEAWADTFKEPSWALPQQTTKDTSPRRGSATTTKRPKAASRKPSVVPNGSSTSTSPSTEPQPESARPKYQAFAEETTNVDADSDAMDIDSNTPPVEKPPPLATGTDHTFKPGTPIKFSTTPSRTAPSTPQDQKPSPLATPNGYSSATAPSSATERPRRASSGLDGLSNLRNVEPFIPTTNGGLSGLSDMGDTLPFPSAPSTTHPTKPTYLQKLSYPSVPSAPIPPISLTEPATTTYLRQMERYVKSYREYNKTMMNHFLSREAELEGCLDEKFVRNRGETTKKLGFQSYMKRLREDEKVMETWKVAQEMHLQAMRRCEEVRNKTLRSQVE